MGRKNHPPASAPAIPWHFCMQMRWTNDDNGDDDDIVDDEDDDDDDSWMVLSQYHQQVVALIDKLTPLHNANSFRLVK